MKTITILKRARRILSNPKRWHQGVMAMSKQGNWVNAQSPKAYSFCAVGAISRAAGAEGSVREHAIKKLAETVGEEAYSIFNWNDKRGRKHSTILRAFDRTIKRLEKLG